MQKNKTDYIKSMFHRQNIENSSDFVVALWQFHNLSNEVANPIDEILRWETANPFDNDWGRNVLHIDQHLHGLDLVDYDLINAAYMACIEFLLNDNTLNKVYPMDENDLTGWRVYKELTEKRNAVEKHRAICVYNKLKESKNV